jgi:hypothetical protein
MSKRSPFRYFKTSPEIIRLAVMMYVRFSIAHMHGLRDLNGMMDTTERPVQTQRLLELSKQVQSWAIGL